ncbi:polysaccharide deacetylase family protein [Cytophaga hutchinsonii]|uniref:Polysaccharide deacetylase n=1 Tax=Cytophaga hutchinsonii (strain ATCC 33406 / DSM 1761 / CIP 103989 / NBRC 15051 / NCIMB 9469 / D465) TaxID=269798 RepID=A0A6N4SNN9_CYTH3|nr:polysaccharide deacetylase family protein [Cytophaga hutchinsonii]ABG57890.1 polysaccharide deacetylase [Cytophaga hutchinsonii ATCC 33406]SFX08276.1 chitin deacetylase [Cytophaga hutchinsonii ATCC 33406]
MIWIIFIAVFAGILIYYRNQGVPVMLFHQVHEGSNVKPKELESYFSYLSENKYQTITLREIDALYKAKQKLPEKSIVLTFDDGYYDNYSVVFPLLKKYNLKAIFFVNTLFVGEAYDRSATTYELADQVNSNLIANYFNSLPTQSTQYFSWEEMREMERSGLVDIQCHSHRHGMVFSNTRFKQVVNVHHVSAGDYFVLNGSVQSGFPLFKMRGELTQAGLQIDEAGKALFKEYYSGLEKQALSKKEKKQKAQQFFTEEFIQQHVHAYSDAEFKARVEKEIAENSTQINTHLSHKKALGFAWPYGHQSTVSLPWIKALGITYFFTCKKGTNARILNPDFIYRIELRKVTAKRLITLTKINSNFALGWLYRWIS